jgi:hypothetical protein
MKTSGRTARQNSRSVFRLRELRSRKPSLIKGFGELAVRRANKLAATVLSVRGSNRIVVFEEIKRGASIFGRSDEL